MLRAKVLAHSISWLGIPIISWELEYPRYIHSELLTHRLFSRNSASSRAIPALKFIEMVKRDPVIPLWTKDQKGMQGPIITDKEDIEWNDKVWLTALSRAVDGAEDLIRNEVHKQNVNRLLEPWMYIRVMVTTTETDNWFELRDHKDAHPEIAELARLMRVSLERSIPEYLNEGEWHMPFGDKIDTSKFTVDVFGEEIEDEEIWKKCQSLKVSVARCARVSYNNFEGGDDPQKDVNLYERLVGAQPLHASPAEHQAKVPTKEELKEFAIRWVETPDKLKMIEERGKYFSNLVGWIQLRKLIECGEFT